MLGRAAARRRRATDPRPRRAVELPDYRARVERVVVIEVEAFDWNCPQHITPRYTEAEIAARWE